MIRVLVVEDSPTVRQFLLQILGSDPTIAIVGTAETGEEAIAAVECTRPDIVTMDVQMPQMNGFDATRRIMETHPTPIVIVSGSAEITNVANAFRAMESGALAVLRTPAGAGHADHEQSTSEFLRTIKTMSEVKLVRRWARRPTEVPPAISLSPQLPCLPALTPIRIVAMGASTGGPPALQTILAGLPSNFPVPILIVQHIAEGFTQGLVDWLAQKSRLPVHLAAQSESALPGQVYVAPDGLHMTVGADGRLHLDTAEPENGLRPSVACLFRSIAKAYGQSAIGVLLTGMGRDGAWELKLMKDQGAFTIAQDQDTAVVHGMPGEAIRLGGATYILSPEKICSVLRDLTTKPDGRANIQDAASAIAGPNAGLDLSGAKKGVG